MMMMVVVVVVVVLVVVVVVTMILLSIPAVAPIMTFQNIEHSSGKAG